MVRLTAAYETEKIADPAVVYFDDMASTSFDQLFDALKLMNTDVTVPNLYAVTPQAERLSISAVPFPFVETSKYPLGIKTEKSDWVLFSASDVENLPSGLRVYLSDDATGLIQDLQLNPQYRVRLNQGTVENRFTLLFSHVALVNELPEKETFYAYISNQKLNVVVKLTSVTSAKLVISNVLGQVMYKDDNFTDGLHEINQSFPAGIFVLTLYSQAGISSTKIYIPK